MEKTMEVTQVRSEKKPKGKGSDHCAIRVTRELRKKILGDLASVNKKPFGRKIKVNELLALAVSKLKETDFKSLQENSFSNADRLARDYGHYVQKFGPISKDEYLGKRLSGELPAQDLNEGKE